MKNLLYERNLLEILSDDKDESVSTFISHPYKSHFGSVRYNFNRTYSTLQHVQCSTVQSNTTYWEIVTQNSKLKNQKSEIRNQKSHSKTNTTSKNEKKYC